MSSSVPSNKQCWSRARRYAKIVSVRQGSDDLREAFRRRGTRVAPEEVLVDRRGFRLFEFAGP